MRLTRPILVAAALAFVACSSDPVAPEDPTIVGNWTATEWWFTSQADTTQTANLVFIGASIAVDIQEDMSYTATVVSPLGNDVLTGVVSVTGNTVSLDLGEGPLTFDMTLAANTLTLVTTDSPFDFDLDGTPDPAEMRLVMARQ